MRRRLDNPVRPTAARLDVASFLARQRQGEVGGHGQGELVGGVTRVPNLPSAREVAAIVGLALRLEQAPSLPYSIQLRPPLHLDSEYLLRPDLALIDDRPRFGAGTTYDPARVGLAVELVRGPATHQRRVPAFARARIRDLWLIDLDEGWVEVYRSPSGGVFRSRTLWYPGETLAPLVAPDWQVTLLEP